MKQIVLFCLALGFSTASLAQYADTSKHTLPADYYKKSKKQKTAAWILLGSGTTLLIGGMVVGLTEATGEIIDAVVTGEDQSSFSAGALLATVGAAAMVGSIPLFIASGKNRRKAAASVSFKMENATNIYQYTVSNARYPAIAIQIRL